MTPASAQPMSRPPDLSGAIFGNIPGHFDFSSACESRMSVIHLVRNPYTSAAYTAAPTNTCVSPVQPQRSLRCGQSVGTLR